MENASVVIIGGGLIGASVAYQLARQGEQDIILLERLDLASAASCQAAGLMFQISSKPAIDELTRTTFKTINTLEEQLGESLDFKRVGTLRLAETEKNCTALNAVFSRAEREGIRAEIVDEKWRADFLPWLVAGPDTLSVFFADEGYIDPYRLTTAYVRAAKQLGVKVKFQQVTSKTRIPMVAAGTIDIAAASMTHKQMRDETIDFTISYFFDGQSMLVRNDEKKTSYKDFAGVRVGAIQGATSGENFKKVQPNAKVVYYQEYPQAIMALKTKKIDAVTTDLVWCTSQAKDSNGSLKVIGGTLSDEPYGMGVPENESNFRDAINMAIQSAVKDGFYSKTYKKWFGEMPEVLPEVWP